MDGKGGRRVFWNRKKAKEPVADERKLTTDVTFEKTVCKVPWNLRTQEIDRQIEKWWEVEGCLLDMFEEEDEFVTLTAGEIQHQIRFVQSCTCAEGIVVELGLEDETGTRLVQKICSAEECMDIFLEFFETTAVHDLDSYHPTEFYTS